ncbi:hypothetical protein PG2093B_1350 [Bifidobacterium pseudolongum subsp. globosum]|uniref:Cell surface protein n=1 Tax=Bifidobacterium pseudolongum subsp. globosum TaxID=1690 RepID=A0A4Q4ZZF0_9BIFI|nr:hypothetical protein [Bifidobacterium pseudolongum]RYQ09066.1 hypothetical protein PG2093B_1350 [Bifidobacterium pseudolongum subsp. globosum]
MIRREITAVLTAVALLLGTCAVTGTAAASEQDSQATSADVAQSVSSTSADATLTLSRNRIGNVPDPADATLTLAVRAHAGDTYTITVPQSIANGNGTYAISDSEEVPPSIGTVTRRDDNASHATTFTYTFSASASFSVNIVLATRNNYYAQPTPIDGVGTSTKTITWSCNGTKLEPIEFTQVIRPVMKPTAITRVTPPSSSYKAIYANQNYTYRFALNETDGVYDDTSWSSAQVNSAVNHGTTIRIPVPKHFRLDQEATNVKNGFTDKTTIAQPDGVSGDIVITVPKGSGRQSWQAAPPYYLVGSYRTEPPQEVTELTAESPVSVDQTVVDPQGREQHLTATVPAWTEYLRPSGDSQLCDNGNTDCMAVSIGGNNTVNDLLLTKDSKLTTLNFVGFGNDSPMNVDDAVLEIKVPSGFDATAVVTPSNAQKLPDLTQYRYEVTLLDGTLMTGTVPAGGTIARSKDSPIRDITLYPNMLDSGADTDAGSSCTTFVDDNAACAGRTMVYVQGTLAGSYDDGTPVRSGDMITTSASLSVPSARQWDAKNRQWTSFSLTASVRQQVITTEELKASLGVYPSQAKRLPGSKDSGYISLWANLDGNQTTRSIHEPVFYYVLPRGVSYDEQIGVTTLNNHDGITVQPHVSAFQATDGRQVVKVDYTGTGYDYYTAQGSNNQVHLDIAPDTAAGSYPWEIYMVSPTTAMTASNAAGVPANHSYVGGASDHVYKVGEGTWAVSAPNAVMSGELSQGNLAYAFASQTGSDDKAAGNGDTTNYADPRTMRFAVTLTNGTPQRLTNLKEFVNVPQRDSGNGFSVQLTGPVTEISSDGSPVDGAYTVLYSTSPVVLTDAKGAVPSTDGFVTADQVTDWSKVRSLVIEMDVLPASAVAGRFVLTGIDPTLVHDAQKTVALSSGLYAQQADGTPMMPLVTRASDADAARITVTGHSTIRARLHWKDESGKDQYKDLDDLTKTYADNLDEFKRSDYPTSIGDFPQTDRALFPDGYALDESATAIIGNDSARYPEGGEPGAAQWNTMTRYNYDGSIVQYELVSQAPGVSVMPVTGTFSVWAWLACGLLTVFMAGLLPVMHLAPCRKGQRKEIPTPKE